LFRSWFVEGIGLPYAIGYSIIIAGSQIQHTDQLNGGLVILADAHGE